MWTVVGINGQQVRWLEGKNEGPIGKMMYNTLPNIAHSILIIT